MKLWILVIFLLNFTPVFMLSSTAAETGKIVKIAIPDDFPPFFYSDENEKIKGASYDIAVEICNRLGYQVEVTQFPNMKMMLSALEKGSHDLTINLTATDKRRSIAIFTRKPHIFEIHSFIVRANSLINFEGNLSDLKHYKIGPVFGWTYGPQFDNANYLNKEYVNDSESQLKGLLSGRYDIAINNPQYVKEIASELRISKAFRILEPAVYSLPVTMAVSRKYPDAQSLVDAIDKEIVNLLKGNTYREILKRYGFNVSSQLEMGAK